MDIGSLLTALNSVDTLAEKNSPYAPFESAASGIGSALLKGAQNYSLPENVIGGLLTGLVGGYAQNLTNDYKAQQSGLARSLLEKALSGQQLDVAPEGMNPSVFSATKNYGDALRLGNALDNQQLAQKAGIDLTLAKQKSDYDLRNGLAEAQLKGILDNPWKAKAALAMFGKDGATTTPGTAAGEAPPAGTVTPGTVTPGTPATTLNTGLDYGSLMNQYGGDETAVNKAIERNLTAPDRARATEDTLASQLLAQKPVQDYVEIGKQYAALQKAYKDQAPASDLDFTIGVMKILDPTSIVRETEQGQVLDTQALPSSLLSQINKSLAGGAALSPEVRQHLLDLADRRYENQKTAVEGLVDNYRKIALSRQANPDAISTRLPAFEIRPLSEIVGDRLDQQSQLQAAAMEKLRQRGVVK